MAYNRTLRLDTRVNIGTLYRNNSFDITNRVLDNIEKVLTLELTNGTGPNKADQQYHLDFRIQNTTQVLNLDDYSLKDVWGEGLNFDAIKLLVLANLEEDLEAPNKMIEYRFKYERGIIGPQGFRIIAEPVGRGIGGYSSSQSEEEGQLVLTTNGDVTGQLIIIGASEEASSSSGT